MGVTLRLMLHPDFEVQTATCAETAVELLRQRHWDAVLCDVLMPGMNGFELLGRVRQEDAALADRFVLMTGGATSEAMARQLADSTVPVVEKPFTPETLRAVLRR